jgi:urease accessory protein
VIIPSESPPLVFTKRIAPDRAPSAPLRLALTAEERTRTRHCFQRPPLPPIFLRLDRGTALQPGDYLQSPTGEVLEILAQPESVLTLTAPEGLTLTRLAYHLGNRHVALEITPTYLRLAPDPVLEKMLRQFPVTVTAEIAPFCPEVGAYGRQGH